MKLTFYGGAESVTGSNYLLEYDGFKLMVECGLLQGEAFSEGKNFEPFEYAAAEIEVVLVTHAHIDHIGLLPKLWKEGFRGKIFGTEPTRDAGELLLSDSKDILRREAERQGRPVLYEDEEVKEVLKNWKVCEYRSPFKVGPFTVIYYNAGHILGSASILIEAGGKKVLFSGDLGNTENLLLPEKDNVSEAEFVLIESTYGDRIHEEKEGRRQEVLGFAEKIINRGGTLLIPAFSMERTQEILFEFNNLIEGGKMAPAPIYFDSPLAINMTKVFKKYGGWFKKEVKKKIADGDDIFDFPGLVKTYTHEESLKIGRDKRAKIIIAGSGMSHGGRIQRHESVYLSDKKNGILFIGYQGERSLGRAIQEAVKKEGEKVRINNKEIKVEAEVLAVSGYSAHADKNELLRWLKGSEQTIKKVFVVQGDKDSAAAFRETIEKEMGVEAILPKNKDEVII